jgi:DNA-binding XRE family transcriptional regulator
VKERHISGISRRRIRATGGAAELGALIADRVPEVRVVGAAAPAEFVLLPVNELAEIIEDAAAQAAYERTRDEETVPLALVDRLLANENPVKVWREHRGLTLTALASKAGIGKGYLSQIERGTRQGPVMTMQKLAAALNVDLDDLT